MITDNPLADLFPYVAEIPALVPEDPKKGINIDAFASGVFENTQTASVTLNKE